MTIQTSILNLVEVPQTSRCPLHGHPSGSFPEPATQVSLQGASKFLQRPLQASNPEPQKPLLKDPESL